MQACLLPEGEGFTLRWLVCRPWVVGQTGVAPAGREGRPNRQILRQAPSLTVTAGLARLDGAGGSPSSTGRANWGTSNERGGEIERINNYEWQ